jgi:hypothetical protein
VSTGAHCIREHDARRAIRPGHFPNGLHTRAWHEKRIASDRPQFHLPCFHRDTLDRAIVSSNPTAGSPGKTRLQRSAANVLLGHLLRFRSLKKSGAALLSLLGRPFLSVYLVHLSFRIVNPFPRRRVMGSNPIIGTSKVHFYEGTSLKFTI